MSTVEQKAAAWDTLMELCGYWQDSSQQQVRLTQDDATCTCMIMVGPNGTRENNHIFYTERGGFMSAIAQARRHLQEANGFDPDL